MLLSVSLHRLVWLAGIVCFIIRAPNGTITAVVNGTEIAQDLRNAVYRTTIARGGLDEYEWMLQRCSGLSQRQDAQV